MPSAIVDATAGSQHGGPRCRVELDLDAAGRRRGTEAAVERIREGARHAMAESDPPGAAYAVSVVLEWRTDPRKIASTNSAGLEW